MVFGKCVVFGNSTDRTTAMLHSKKNECHFEVKIVNICLSINVHLNLQLFTKIFRRLSYLSKRVVFTINK